MKRPVQISALLALVALALLALLNARSRVASMNQPASTLMAPPRQSARSVVSFSVTNAAAAKAALHAQTNAEPIEAFNRWLQTFTLNRADAEELGVELARQRRKALGELIQRDPEQALQMRIPFSVRQRLPSAIQEQLEERVSGRGDLAVFGALPFAGREADFQAIERWARIDGRTYRAYVYGRRASQATSREVSLHGIAVDGMLALSDSTVRLLDSDEPASAAKQSTKNQCPISGKEVASTTAEASTPDTPLVESGDQIYRLCSLAHASALSEELWAQEESAAIAAWASTGANNVLVLIVDFPDLPGANTTTGDALDVMNEVDQFYRANSFQQFSFGAVEVTSVLRLPRASTAYATADPSQLLADARSAAAALGFNVFDYRLDVVSFHYIGFPWGGLGYIGGKGAFVQGPSLRPGTVEHELGHNLGNRHAGGWLTDDESVLGPGRRLEFGNEFDIMGSGPGHLNANFKLIAGWLSEPNVLTISNNGTYRLHAMDTGAELIADHFYALRIPAGPSLHGLPSDYWLDFRQQFTNSPLAMSGVLVHWATNTPGVDHNQLLDMNPGAVSGFRDAPLVVGRTFVDAARGIFITPVAKGGSGADVWLDIAVKFRPTNVSSPAISLNASSLTASPGETVQFTATASDADGDMVSYSWDFGDGSVPEGSLNQPAVSKSWVVRGEYVVRCTVSDMKGGEGSASVLVRVGNPSTFHISGRVLWQGNPLQGVRVNNGLTGADFRGAWTDSDGGFVLVGLAASSYLLRTVKPGFNFAATFTNPVTVVSQHVEGLVFYAETNNAMFITEFVPRSGAVGSTVAIRGLNLFPPLSPGGVSFGGVPSVNYSSSYGSFTQITAVVPHGAVTGPVILKTWWWWYGVPTATSAMSFVVLPTAPGILTQPQSQTNGFGFDARFRVTASGSGPFAYQWRKDGMEIPAGTNRVLILTNLQSEHTGNYDVIVANPVGSITSAVAWLEVVQTPTFEEALDTTNLLWTTGGDIGWRTQTNFTYDEMDAAESGELSLASDASWLETTVNGPGTLRFYYFRPPTMDLSLRYGESPAQLTNVVYLTDNWTCCWWTKEVRIPAGTQVLRWHARTSSPESSPKAGLDEVSFTSGLPPLITRQPENHSVPVGGTATFEVQAEGTEPLFYEWFDYYGGPIPGATNRTFTVNNATTNDARSYSVRVYNTAGEARSYSAYLSVVGPPAPYLSVASDVQAGNISVGVGFLNPGFAGIARLELFDGITRLVARTNLGGGSYFLLTVSNMPPGRRLSLFAIATDNWGQIGTSAVVNVSVVLQLVQRSGLWKYLDDGNDPGPAWRELNFDDRTWLLGVAPFGYPPNLWDPWRPRITTVIWFGDPTNKFITTWFRRAFTVPDTATLSNAVLWLNRDDGAVVYLNGIEIFRSNMPKGEANSHTLAAASVEGSEHAVYFPKRISPDLFVNGTNVLAAEVHQADPASEDMYFDSILTAYLPSEPQVAIISPSNGEAIQGIAVPLHAVAVDPDGEIVRVEFFWEGTKIGEAVTAPYTIVWTNAPFLLDYLSVTARATDDSGTMSTSAPVNIWLTGPPDAALLTSIHWQYLDGGSDPGPNWHSRDFDSENWGSGDTILGTSPAADTIIDTGPPGARHPTTYFRSSLSLYMENPPRFTGFTLYLFSELADGAIVYVNGMEIFRTNLPAGSIAATNYTELPPAELGWIEANVDPGELGEYNVIAVEMHQNSPDSDVLAFDLALIGYVDLSAPELRIEQTGEGLMLHWEGKWVWDPQTGWVRRYGLLEQAFQIDGPWEPIYDVGGTLYVFETDASQRFFRLRWP